MSHVFLSLFCLLSVLSNGTAGVVRLLSKTTPVSLAFARVSLSSLCILLLSSAASSTLDDALELDDREESDELDEDDEIVLLLVVSVASVANSCGG